MEPTQTNPAPVTPAPMNPVPPQAAQPAPVMTPPSKKSSHVVALIILVIVLVVIGAGVAFADYAGFFTSPESAVRAAVINQSNIKTDHTDLVITADFITNSLKQNMQVEVKGNTDKTDKENPKADLSLTFNGFGVNASAEMRLIAKTFYFKIDQIPMAGLLSSAQTAYIGKWLSISNDDIQKARSMSASAASASTASASSTFPQFTEADSKTIYAIIDKYRVLKEVSSQGVSSKNGAYVRTYRIVLDKTHFVDMAIEMAQYMEAKTGDTSMSKLTSDQISQARTTLQKILDQVTFGPILIDVGVLDGNVYNIQSSVTITPDASSGMNVPVSDIHVGFNVSYSDFNKPVLIEAPTDSKSIMDLIQESMTSARSAGSDAAVKNIVMDSRPEAELYFSKKNSYAGFCKSTNAQSMISQLTKYSSSAPTCLDNSQQFAFASRLASGSYYCADYTGAAVTIPGAPVVARCK